MLQGFDVTLINSLEEVAKCINDLDHSSAHPIDFVILDDQSENRAEELARLLTSLRHEAAFADTKIVHYYTPTTSLSGHALFGNTTPGVVKITKPPRKARLLQTLAGMRGIKGLPNPLSLTSTHVTKAMEDLAAAKRTLFGNVLVAEGPIITLQLPST